MFFPISKIFWAIAEPVALLLYIGLAGVILSFTRFGRIGRILMASAILGLAVGLFTPLGTALLRPLEDRFPQPPTDMAPPTGIIVLGGALDPKTSEARGQTILASDANRLTAAVELARRYPEARVVYSGGAGFLWSESPPEAYVARDLWLALGLPAERISFEAKSRNTFENALYTRELLDPQPGQSWLLVTSAWHMPRSVGIFRRVGMSVVPFPVAYHTFGDARDWQWNAGTIDRLFALNYAVREWIGLFVYWLTDKTDALFPGPDLEPRTRMQPTTQNG
jgi:uncharacterized SAM-binding protein YcdF (DUF218 family)